MNRLVIVCNSINPDLVEYFKCKIDSLKQSPLKNNYIALKNRRIELDDSDAINSSYAKSAFFDKLVPLDFLLSFRLLFVVLRNNVKVIHFTTAHISNLFLSVLLKPFSVKQIFTIHDLSPHPDGKSKFIELYNKVIIKYLSDEVISFSKKEIDKQNYKNKFKYLPLMGFESKISVAKPGKKNILFFGRMEPYKGLDHLFNIINLANNNGLDYKFVIAGKGFIPNMEKFEKFNNVEIINRFIDDTELEGLFLQASFSLLPYDSATQSGVILLSYTYATPVIAYDVGALGEYIEEGENGYLVTKNDDKRIIDILKNSTSENILNMSQNVIDIFNRVYSIDQCKKLYKKYYMQLLGA